MAERSVGAVVVQPLEGVKIQFCFAALQVRRQRWENAKHLVDTGASDQRYEDIKRAGSKLKKLPVLPTHRLERRVRRGWNHQATKATATIPPANVPNKAIRKATVESAKSLGNALNISANRLK
jgi:hypothetical protein